MQQLENMEYSAQDGILKAFRASTHFENWHKKHATDCSKSSEVIPVNSVNIF